ncbi:MAG: folate-binding protein [Cyanobacteria bacterium]|nr:folate-binding protein [Cyanobacteriota bacterium]MDW8202494.1 folate-binding protein [Cyanobacteriota bacterium SKYGB_h_bin112]
MGQDIQTASTLDILGRDVMVYDSSHWGLLAISGNDRLRYLHNQSTNNFNALQPGQGCDTVFVTSTARTIDLVTAYVLETTVWLLVSPNRRQRLLDWMDRFIFPADQVDLKDITDQMAVFRILGTGSQSLLSTLGATITGAYGDHQTVTIADVPCRLAIGSGLALPGYTLLTEIAYAPTLQAALVAAGATMIDDRTWEFLRIHQGRPLPDAELTEDYNPLEAGLWHTISFNKGCYIGQETIARLNTYNGVKQHLWGIRLNRFVPAGTPLMVGDEKVGRLTSVATPETGGTWQGLAYVRTKAGGVGLVVQVGDAQGEIIDVPFLTRSPQ